VKRLAISMEVSDQLFLDVINFLMSGKHVNILQFLGYCANAQGKGQKRFCGAREVALLRVYMLRKSSDASYWYVG
jgi:hypothetical protein